MRDAKRKRTPKPYPPPDSQGGAFLLIEVPPSYNGKAPSLAELEAAARGLMVS